LDAAALFRAVDSSSGAFSPEAMHQMTHRDRILIMTALAFATVASVCARASAAGPDSDDAADASSMLIATADFNGDGIADIAEVALPEGAQKSSGILTVLLGQRNGSFKPASHYTLSEADARTVVAGDFNGDHFADLLIGGDDGTVTELLGDGNGHLRSAGEVAHVGSAVSIAVGDFNRDGMPDIAISDFRGNTVAILLGSGQGMFRFGWSFTLPMRGTVYYLAAADFNGDGLPDLAITSDEEGTFVVMLANGNGTFTYAPALSRMRDPNSYCPT
jgi:hypothetical protein